MKNAKGYERQSLYWAAVCGILLLMWLAVAMRHPIRFQDRIRSPGFGWSWDFNFQRAMREPRLTMADPINQIQPPPRDQFVLTQGDATAIAGLKIIYRGETPSGGLRLDVTVPSLDAVYAYPYTISITEARKGFTIFDHRFLLRAKGPSFIQLTHLTGSKP